MLEHGSYSGDPVTKVLLQPLTGGALGGAHVVHVSIAQGGICACSPGYWWCKAVQEGLTEAELMDLSSPIGETPIRGTIMGMTRGDLVKPCSPSYCSLPGRTHQLRVHCSAIGHAIVGDFTYSHKKDSGPYRMMLHAYYLRIPTSKELIEVCTPDPFVTAMDGNWVPQHIVRRLDETIQELKDKAVQKGDVGQSQQAVPGDKEEEALSKAKSLELEEQRVQCEQWLAEWALE